MADSKVTDFTAATSVNTADVLYLIQNNTDKKISVSTLLANLPNTITRFSGLIAIDGAEQTLIDSGSINNTATVTYISNTIPSTLALPNGLYNGQIKYIMMTNGTNASVITSNIAGVSTLSFTRIGHTATLMWVASQSKWFLLGGTATIVV